jgi:hypothetical protein
MFGEDGSGGLAQDQSPRLGRVRRPRRSPPEQLDLLGPGGEDDGPEGDGLVPQAPLIAAHAANEGSGRQGDLLPSF